jgi:hypothetical protein
LTVSGLFQDLIERVRPLATLMFPRLVLLEIDDQGLRGHVLRNDRPEPLSLRAPLPALTCREGMPLEKESLGDLVGDLLLSEQQLDAYVMAVLPFEACYWRVLVRPFPEPPDDPIEALQQLDPPLNLPFSLAEASIDLLPLAGHPDQMLMVAAPRRLVDAWIDVFRLAGAKLERLSPAQGCLMAALSGHLLACDDDELVALVMPWNNDCLLWFFHQGVPVFERLLPADGPELIDELRRCLAFYHRQEPGLRQLRLLQTQRLDVQMELEQELGVRAEILSPEPYGSLLLQGLAIREGQA